ncbi:PGRS family protein [Sorangium sp. So ce448]|uniref:PGRS family protein n=1 Tax=Sorangium sp. So ce448 TaxID=3133314 RepID=UPI003F5DA7D4
MRIQAKQRVWATAAIAIMASGCDALWLDVTGNCQRMVTCDYFLQAGSGGGTPASCVPSENPEAVGDACGVFVSVNGNDDGAGTKAEPVKTLSVAITRAAELGSAVYACAETFAEAAELPAGVTMFGGLDCANGWTWIGETAKTVVAPAEEGIALKLLRGEGVVRIEDVSVHVADAEVPGTSSIAVLVDGAEAELARCELVAGKGADGAEGEDAPSEVPAQASPGNTGADACSDLDGTPGPDAKLSGGSQVVNECGGELSIGGGGGDGNVTNGTSGDIGASGALGAAGAGEPAAGNWSCAAGGTGQGGDNGPDGNPGDAGSGLGTLSSSGYVGVSGKAGEAGKPGQGGGGGGGAKGGAAICAGGSGAGASGGSGGPGGCGGLPGQGGGAGGASIALASVEGKVTLKDCVLKAGEGGKGGAGGDLQPGGTGGLGGVGGMGVGGSKNACAGGQGGQGGNGGPGGGGLGGPSLAIAFRGEGVKQEGQTMLMPGTPGMGGPGGSSNVAENAGAEGTAAVEQKFP